MQMKVHRENIPILVQHRPKKMSNQHQSLLPYQIELTSMQNLQTNARVSILLLPMFLHLTHHLQDQSLQNQDLVRTLYRWKAIEERLRRYGWPFYELQGQCVLG